MTEPNRLEAALLRTMTLLASLNVATEVALGMRERKAGYDPSANESEEEALPSLREDLDTLKVLAFELQSSLALSQNTAEAFAESQEAAVPVTRFVDLVRIQKAGRLLHRIHQRLLSLYPSVEAAYTEEARTLKNRCDALSECPEEDFVYALTSFVEATNRFIYQLRRSLQINWG